MSIETTPPKPKTFPGKPETGAVRRILLQLTLLAVSFASLGVSIWLHGKSALITFRARHQLEQSTAQLRQDREELDIRARTIRRLEYENCCLRQFIRERGWEVK